MKSKNPEYTKLLLTPRQAAAALSVCEKTLWSMSEPRGPIPVVRLGTKAKAVRYSAAALAEWIAKSAAGTPIGRPR